MDGSHFTLSMINDEIRHHIGLAAEDGGILQTSIVVKAIKRTYPIELTERELEDMVISSASKAGLALEMGMASDSA